MTEGAPGSAAAEAAVRSLSLLATETDIAPKYGLVTICTVLEVYIDTSLQHLIDSTGVQALPFGALLLDHLADQFSQTWQARLRWLDKGFAISLAGTAVDNDRATLIEARNAIIHGAGVLTSRQLRNPTEAIDLQKRLIDRLDATLNGPSLVITQGTFSRALEVARSYIIEIDRHVKTKLEATT